MKSDMQLPFIGILSTLDMRRSYFEYTRPTTEGERVEINPSRIFIRQVPVVSIPSYRVKNLFLSVRFFLLVSLRAFISCKGDTE
jgi:hypothetical protein